ncbi:MAG: hypothetical protein WC942_01095 [Clostridia bacterium]|jgi:hypothetical protein
MMVSVYEFSEIFNHRHDFNCTDINILSDKYTNIIFKNIPEAWILEIDKFLSLIKQPKKIFKISQEFGFLVIFHNDKLIQHDKEILQQLENNLTILDIDLHSQLKEGIILN